ncbi:MAG: replication initiation protein [Filifactoraceae bacterium]
MSSKDKRILMKHNDIVNGKYEITVNSNRVFTYLLYEFQKDLDKSKLSCEISRDKLASLVNGNVDKTAKGLTTILMNLRKKDLFLIDELQDGSIDFIAGGFIDNATYNNKTDKFTIVADARIHKLLHRYLEDGYTPINLEIWLSLKNRYSQRLYDLLRAWTGTKTTVTYSIEKLRSLMMLENKYKQYPDFRKRVIIPAIDELNSTGYFEISYNENKKGRNIESIDFVVKDLDKRKYFTKGVEEEISLFKEVAVSMDDDSSQKVENVVKVNKETCIKEAVKEIFIPDEEVFTKGTLRSFKKDFRDIDFRNEYMERAFDDAVMITLDRDDVESIKASSYKFFKSTLDNKVIEYKKEEQEDLNHKKDMDTNW